MTTTKPPAAYAQTRVSPFKSQEDVEKLLRRYKVESFRWTNHVETTLFEFSTDQQVPFRMRLQWGDERRKAQFFRALFFFVKSQLEAVDFGLLSFEEAFMPAMMINGRTVAELVMENGSNLLPVGRG